MTRFEHVHTLAMGTESGGWTQGQGQAKARPNTSSLLNEALRLLCQTRHCVDYLTVFAYKFTGKNNELNLVLAYDSVWRQKLAA